MRRVTWVYIARCGDGTLYTGVTTDLHRRLAQHSAGRGARYTRGRGGVRLRYCEAAATRGQALRREAAIKRLPRARKLRLANPPGIRPGRPADLPFIHRTIAALDLDPERVAHEQFFVAVEGRARIGFVRIKPYARCFELGSLAVLPRWRGRGRGARLARFVIARFPTRRVWITTDLVGFFVPLGFREAVPPADLRRKLAGITHQVHRTGIVAMVASKAHPGLPHRRPSPKIMGT
ncbi:MAG: GIY-YIG nuclease family protein [Deltaproteobacteria bacterium]|nr:GIY-YIG nuclease family protein [Deltaproteobacteria bacterium]